MGSRPGKQRIAATLTTDLNIESGDQVSVVLEARHLLRASILVYGYPLLGALFAALVSWLSGLGDIASAVAAIAGLVAGIAVARIRLGRADCLREFTPTIGEKIGARLGGIS